MAQPDRATARQLAQQSLARGDATGWFDTLYELAEGDASRISWADQRVNPHLAAWLGHRPAGAPGRRALVVGCGLGDDAEELARRGFRVTAFDVSPQAVAWCRRRYPATAVDYCVADLLALPPTWRRAFDFVVEVYTLQVLPPDVRAAAVAALADSVAIDGTLLVIARGREPADDAGAMPWPLTKSELAAFAREGLSEVAFDDFLDDEDPPVRRFRVEYRRRD